jgi:hypothetical protein
VYRRLDSFTYPFAIQYIRPTYNYLSNDIALSLKKLAVMRVACSSIKSTERI